MFSLDIDEPEVPRVSCFTLRNGFYVDIHSLYEHLNSSLFLNAKIVVYENEKNEKVVARFIKIHKNNSHCWELDVLQDEQDFDSCFVVVAKPAVTKSQPLKKGMVTHGKFTNGTKKIADGYGSGDNRDIKKAVENYFNL